jgi:hypothetical protein
VLVEELVGIVHGQMDLTAFACPHEEALRGLNIAYKQPHIHCTLSAQEQQCNAVQVCALVIGFVMPCDWLCYVTQTSSTCPSVRGHLLSVQVHCGSSCLFRFRVCGACDSICALEGLVNGYRAVLHNGALHLKALRRQNMRCARKEYGLCHADDQQHRPALSFVCSGMLRVYRV